MENDSIISQQALSGLGGFVKFEKCVLPISLTAVVSSPSVISHYFGNIFSREGLAAFPDHAQAQMMGAYAGRGLYEPA